MTSITEALTIALDLHLSGRLGEAQDLYGRILDVDPDQPDALHYLGVLAGQIGQGEFGLTLIARAMALRPEAADIRANGANLLKGLRRPRDARSAYRQAIALQPDFAEAWVDSASLCRELGDGDGAITALERATRAAPELAVARDRLVALLHERARLMLESGRALAALPSLFRAVDLSPLDADSAFILGNALFAAGLRQDSLAAYRRAVALSPDFESAVFNLGIALARVDRVGNAVAVLRHAAFIDPTHLDALENLAVALSALGRTDEANDWAGLILDQKDRLALADTPRQPPLPAVPRGRERRARNVIAFSLWGRQPQHIMGALANARLTTALFAGWQCRVYHDDSVPADALAALAAAGADLVAMPSGSGPVTGSLWRFFVSDDPTVARFLCRACDARLNGTDARAVQEWVRSGRPFHILRDGVLQTDLVPAGQWGGMAGLLPDLAAAAERFTRSAAERNLDQRFLRRWVWPLIRKQVLIHDRTHRRHGLPFPDGPDGAPPDRIGQRFEADGSLADGSLRA